MERLWNRNYMKVWTANFMLFFSFMVLTPLLPLYLSDTFGAGKHTIGLILSGYTLTALMMRSVSGYLVDSRPRKLVLMVCYGLFAFFFAGYFVTGWSLVLFALIRTLHGAPFGAATVANSTVAIDVLHPTRRAEGIGYYGLSNNIATALSPSVGLYIYELTGNYNLIFLIALLASALGVCINATLKLAPRELQTKSQKLSLDRFFLVKGWREGIAMVCYAYSYGVLATYLAIYGKERLGIIGGSGLFFMILSAGLILSRLIGTHTLRQGKIVHNAAMGICISVFGYILFASVAKPWAFYGSALIIGLGNGHMFPAFQNMFINLAPHSQRGTANSTLLTSWDVGMGLGIVVGGALSEAMGYGAAFYSAAMVNMFGVIYFFWQVKGNYLRNRLR